ncbi:MAG: intermembrane transport protein PqiB [Myxococcota bacterium]
MSDFSSLPPHDAGQGSHAPEARIKKHWTSYWIWLIPLAALILVGYLGYQFLIERGPVISITFETAEGLKPQQTEVKYKAVTIGRVEEVELSEDRTHVTAKVRMDPKHDHILTEHARFWVVRPRLEGGLSGLQAGLKTLVSGSYVTVDPGDPPPDAEMKTHFEGLAVPPSIRSNQPGTVYVLEADKMGSLKSGSLVRYRGTDVGEVLSHKIVPNNNGVQIRIFVESPYDEHVVEETRFWNASGISIGSDGDGMKIEILSAKALFRGGIVFDTPTESLDDPPADLGTTFELYESEAAARTTFYESHPYVSYFQSSVRGLSVGSEVHKYGRRVGAVTDVSLTRDPREGHEGQFAVRVEYVLQPERVFPEEDRTALQHEGIGELVDRDLRVVLHSTNLLTGEKALSLQYIPTGEPVELTREGEAIVLPSDTQDFSEVTSTLASIANDIDRIPFAQIGNNLNRTLASLEQTVGGPELKGAIESLDATMKEAEQLVKEAREGIGPALAALPSMATKLEGAAAQAEDVLGSQGYGPGSDIHRNLQRLIENVSDAARSVRVLAEHLERQPESLLRGRDEETP